MTIKVRRTWMLHSGGTKFYQLFHIVRLKAGMGSVERQTHDAAVGHYGPMSAIKGGDKRPISGGQSKVYPGADYQRLMEEKQRTRNGGQYNRQGATAVTDYSEDGFCTMLRETFPTITREEILAKLGLDLAGNGMAVDQDNLTNDPLDEPSDDLETPSEVPEGWGSW